MINAKWDKKRKITKAEMNGDKESLVNEFGTILDGLMKANVLNVDNVTTILSKVVYDNKLDDQVIDSHKKSINDLIKTLLK